MAVITLRTTYYAAAHASSPATSQALLQELASSQPLFVARIARGIPDMLPKAYRWEAEMEEISDFVASGLAKSRGSDIPPPVSEAGPNSEGHVHFGLARLYENVAKSLKESEKGEDVGEVKVLKDFVEKAQQMAKQAQVKSKQ